MFRNVQCLCECWGPSGWCMLCVRGLGFNCQCFQCSLFYYYALMIMNKSFHQKTATTCILLSTPPGKGWCPLIVLPLCDVTQGVQSKVVVGLQVKERNRFHVINKYLKQLKAIKSFSWQNDLEILSPALCVSLFSQQRRITS